MRGMLMVQAILFIVVGLMLTFSSDILSDDGIIGYTGNSVINFFGDISEEQTDQEAFLSLVGFFLIAFALIEMLFLASTFEHKQFSVFRRFQVLHSPPKSE